MLRGGHAGALERFVEGDARADQKGDKVLLPQLLDVGLFGDLLA
jgi:hypothetical protein